MKRKLLITLAIVLVLFAAGFGWLWFAPCGLGGCAPVAELERFQAEGSRLFDTDGEPIGTLATVNRRVVSLDSLPAHLPQAVLAVEDRRFYRHGGVDWRRFMGAMVRNVRAGGVEEGGSTITMQLARNLFPEHLPYRERSIRRKAMEIRVARQIERAFDKRKILELYLNHIYLGEGAYGVDAAARTYFGKPAAELTLAEAALIGGLPQSPSRLNPRENRELARRRRDLVLREMADAGFISAAEADEAAATEIELARRDADDESFAPYFVDRVRRELEERVGPEFYTSGLRVYTTLDRDAQTALEEELSRQARAIENGGFGAYRHPSYESAKGETVEGATPYLQTAGVVMEVRTGAVRALVGGRDHEDSEFDRVWQGLRQPGSVFKPFVYLTALERSIPPTRRMEDAPVRLALSGGRTWEPRNYTGRYDGPITVREALTRSKNTVTVRLAQEVGIPAVVRTARQMGITSNIPNVPATALGAAEVRPIEVASAYATLAAGGARPEPYVIERIEDRDGLVVYEAAPSPERVVGPAAAFVLTTMLRDVVDRGTGTAVRAAGFRGPAAGKTGTTNGATDVWFAGYTPELVGVVWFGLDRPATIVRGASGGTLAAPVWGRLMARIHRTREMPAEWTMPRGVVTEQVDRATGYVVDPYCPPQGEVYTEYFVHVRPPRPVCQPGVPYPAMALDSVYPGLYAYDTSWEEYDPDTVGVGDLRDRGIDWPELEERRRRGDTLAAPLPGRVDTRPERAAPPPPRREPRITEPPPAPPPAPRTTPPPADDTEEEEDDGPPLLGEPVQRPPPPASDSIGANG